MSKGHDYFFKQSLAEIDPDAQALIRAEEEHQQRKLIMIASESLCPAPVREALSSVFTNLYAEGYPSLRMLKDEVHLLDDHSHQLAYMRRYASRRYYKGVDFCDFAETMAIQRCAEIFANEKVPAEGLFVNVQPLSGAAANNAVYEAFVNPGDTVMGMSLSHGGHLTHGSPVNRSGKRYHVVSYEADRHTGKIDFDKVKALVLEHRPKMIIAGYSAYPWAVEWDKFREIADLVGAILLADISHVAGLVVGGVYPSPVGIADVISFTTHKTMCGPRGAVIMTTKQEYANKIDMAVFPGEQGGPHINNILAKAICFKIAATDEFKQLQKRIYDNAQHLAKAFVNEGFKLAYGGTDSHMLLLDLKSIPSRTGEPLSGEIVSRMLDLCGIVVNRNTVMGDKNAVHPSAVRFGTTWVSQRGMGKEHMIKIAAVVKKIIDGIYSFNYQETMAVMGRGKLEFGVFESAREDIAKLEASCPREFSEIPANSGYPYYEMPEKFTGRESFLSKYHRESKATVKDYFDWKAVASFGKVDDEFKAAQSGAVVFDDTHKGVLDIHGDADRVRAFLDGICTAEIPSMAVGDVRRSFVLDADAKVMDDVTVYRVEPLRPGHARYLVLTSTANTARMRSWMRAISDGYTVFDRADIYAKVEGPVVIEDCLTTPDEKMRLVAVTLHGPESDKIAAKLDKQFSSVGENKISRIMHKKMELFVSRFVCKNHNVIRYTFLASPANIGDVWAALIDAKATPAGTEAGNKLRAAAKLPDYSAKDRPDARALFETHPHLFHISKPYFVGQRELVKGINVKCDKVEYKYQPPNLPLRRTPLFEEHLKLTKKNHVIPFAGWEMPVWYTGITDEHLAVRKAAGLFDVAHMGVLEVSGEHAGKFLDVVSANYVLWLKDGQSQYSYVLGTDGIPLDDIIVYRIQRDRYMIVVNASNAEKVEAWFRAVNSKKYIIDKQNPLREIEGEVNIRNLKDPSSGADMRVDMALQGPASREVIRRIAESEDLYRRVVNLKKFEFVRGKLAGIDTIISNTGYTGEHISFELYHHPQNTVKLWNTILQAGQDLGVKPAGLGARDSTRTEAGLPLYGHELAGDFSIQPMGAGYGAFAKLHKPFYIGRDAFIANEKTRQQGIIRFRMTDRGVKPVKPGAMVFARKTGALIGRVTSCAFAGETQIGLAYVDNKYSEPGTPLAVVMVPEKIPAGKWFDQMHTGDKTLIPEEAVVLTRFPKHGEMCICD